MAERSDRMHGKEPNYWFRIKPTPVVEEIVNALGTGARSRRHMQQLPPGRFLYYAQLSYLYASPPFLENDGHETVPMIRIELNSGPKTATRKVMELYGPAYVRGSKPVRAVSGLGENQTYVGCTLFVPPQDLPPKVSGILRDAEFDTRYWGARSLRLSTEGATFKVESEWPE